MEEPERKKSTTMTRTEWYRRELRINKVINGEEYDNFILICKEIKKLKE